MCVFSDASRLQSRLDASIAAPYCYLVAIRALLSGRAWFPAQAGEPFGAVGGGECPVWSEEEMNFIMYSAEGKWSPVWTGGLFH